MQAGPHGAMRLHSLVVDGYNAEIKHGSGFVGDRASSRVFQRRLVSVQDRMASKGQDPTWDETVERIVAMLRRLIARAAREKRALAPFVAVGCPGVDRPRRHHQAWRPEPARQLGARRLQPAGPPARRAATHPGP